MQNLQRQRLRLAISQHRICVPDLRRRGLGLARTAGKMTAKPKKRRWVYAMTPAAYGIAGCPCGNEDPQWSEFRDHLWCETCRRDFVPAHWGLFDGPIPVGMTGLLGISFARVSLRTRRIIRERATK